MGSGPDLMGRMFVDGLCSVWSVKQVLLGPGGPTLPCHVCFFVCWSEDGKLTEAFVLMKMVDVLRTPPACSLCWPPLIDNWSLTLHTGHCSTHGSVCVCVYVPNTLYRVCPAPRCGGRRALGNRCLGHFSNFCVTSVMSYLWGRGHKAGYTACLSGNIFGLAS